MSAELVTIREESTPWGLDRTNRLIMSDLGSRREVLRLVIDRGISFGIPLDGRTPFQPVFAEAHAAEEIPLIMNACGRGISRWVEGRFRVHPSTRRLQVVEFKVPHGHDHPTLAALKGLFAHVNPNIIESPHQGVLVNGRLLFGYWPQERAVRQYYPMD